MGLSEGYDLSENCIGPAGVESLALAIKTHQTLRRLNLCCCNVGNQGAEFLSEMLKNNQVLVDINLSYNNIYTVGSQFLALGLQNNRTLLNLNMSFNNIGGSGTADLIERNQTLMSLNVANNFIGPGDTGIKKMMEVLTNNTTLLSLTIKGNAISLQNISTLNSMIERNKRLSKQEDAAESRSLPDLFRDHLLSSRQIQTRRSGIEQVITTFNCMEKICAENLQRKNKKQTGNHEFFYNTPPEASFQRQSKRKRNAGH